jgi:transcriptional regulator GlxA family with amidase domain
MSPSNSSGGEALCRVAVLLFPGADILDFAGPLEIFSHASHNKNPDAPQPIFSAATAGRPGQTSIPTGHGTLLIQPQLSIRELLDTLSTFDVLVVPGGPLQVIQTVVGQEDGLELEVIKAFFKLGPKEGGGERIMLSVCTGAYLLGAAGVLRGLKVTTHHRALDGLKGVCDKDGIDSKTEVVGGQRFVDAGIVKDGLRIVTAGGVSSGLDATLHVVELVKDRDTANYVAGLTEYERRQV